MSEPKKTHARFWADIGRHLSDSPSTVEIDEDADGERWMMVCDGVAAVRQRMLASFASGAWKPESEWLQLAMTGLMRKLFPPLSTPPTAAGPADELLRALLPFVPSAKRLPARFALHLSPYICEAGTTTSRLNPGRSSSSRTGRPRRSRSCG